MIIIWNDTFHNYLFLYDKINIHKYISIIQYEEQVDL